MTDERLDVMRYRGVDNLEAMEEADNYERFLTELIDEFGRPLKRVAPLLDFGAGIGTYAKQARSLGYDILCIEADDSLRRRLQSQGFRTATLAELSDGSQCALYSFNVLEHIEDDVGTLRQIRRVLQPGGRVLLYLPAFPLLYSNMDRHVGHFRRYRRAQLVRIVQDAGFNVESCVYADSLGFAAALLYKLALPHADGGLDGRNVRRYDRMVFPLSRKLDVLLNRWLGKNLVLTASRPSDGG